jgi:hypothetical protein
MMKKLLIAALCFGLSSVTYAASCQTETIRPSTPDSRYVDNEDGTALDMKTGLLWSVCSIGQAYVDGACEGTATNFSSMGEALQEADDVRDDYLGTDGWRVPNIKELDSIVERQCSDPAINTTIFPDTPSASYYSSTPDPDSLDNMGVRTISFFTGEEYTPPTEPLRHIRLVKDSRF